METPKRRSRPRSDPPNTRASRARTPQNAVKGKGKGKKRTARPSLSPSPSPSRSSSSSGSRRQARKKPRPKGSSLPGSLPPSPPCQRKRLASVQTPPITLASQPKMSRWQPPHVEFKRRNVLCMTKAEAHAVYNLNNCGQDPRTVFEDIFSDEDWLQVFYEVPKRGSKVKCKIVRREHWDGFYTLFTSVYQEPPGNYGMEVTRAFAKGFLYEQVKGPADWAAFAESIVAHMEARKLQSKKQRWAAFHSSSAPPSSRRKTVACDLDDCNAIRRSDLHVPVKMQLGPHAVDQLDDLLGMVARNHDKALKELDEVSLKLEGKKANLHRNEGAMALIQSLTKQLEAARARLQEAELLEDTSQVQSLQKRVANLVISLETVGVDFEYVDCADALDMAHIEAEMKQSNAKLKGAQLEFVKDMQSRKSPVLLQVPPPKVPKLEAKCDGVTSCCSACGVAMFDDEVLGIFMLPCRHEYHLYCFAHIAAKGDTCLVSGCSQVISQNIRSWVSIDGGNTSYTCVKIGKHFYFFFYGTCKQVGCS